MNQNNDPTPSFGGGKPEKKKKKISVLGWILIVLLLLLAGVLAAIIIFINSTLNRMERIDPSEPWITPEQAEQLTEEPDEFLEGSGDEYGSGTDVPLLQEEHITWPSAPDDESLLGEEEHILNILLVGQDRRPGEGRARSDSMILVSINKEKGTINMVSFMRDTYVQIPGGYRDNRLNVAYRFGGPDLLNETLAINYGIHVDANVEVDFSGFKNIIDALGGVDISLTSAEAAHLNIWCPHLTPGMNRLSGSEALAYARIRKIDSDFGRTNRQRNVLNSIINSLKGISLTEAIDLANTLLPLVSTNMSNAEIIRCIGEIYPMFAQGVQIDSFSIPRGEGYYNATIRGMMVLVPDLEYCRLELNSRLR